MQEVLDHMTVKANLTVQGVTSVADPVNPTDAVNKRTAVISTSPNTVVKIGPVGSEGTLGLNEIFFGF